MTDNHERTRDSSEFEAVLQACRANLGSAILLRTLLDEATRSGRIADAVGFLSDLEPSQIGDAGLREFITRFLHEAGAATEATRWGAEPRVITLAEHRPIALPPATSGRPIRFEDVGGLADAKRQIHRRIIAPRERPGLFQRFGRRAGGGVLLYGPPGCGKTMLARAAAGEARVNFIEMRIADVLDRWMGESEKHVAAAFAEAQSRKPAILFVDEIEALAAQRHFDGNQSMASVVSAFLSAFDGLATANDGVLVLAATNLPWAVDSAFRRPGRFDRVIFIPPPDREARLAILRGLFAERPLAPGVDLAHFAAASSGYSGADLVNLVETAIDVAIEQSLTGAEVPAITRHHLEDALAEVKPTAMEWLATARNYAKYAPEPGLYTDLLAFLERHGR